MGAKADHDPNALLKNLVPLNTLSDEHLGQLVSETDVEQVNAGTYLFRQGDTDHQHVYLLEGRVSLLSGRKEVDVIRGGSSTARFALAHQSPRQLSARAATEVRLVRIDSRALSDLLVRGQSQSYRVSELEADADEDWMTQVLRSKAFQQLPAANIQNVLRRMQPIEAQAGDVIAGQGEEGDYYYILLQGACSVLCREGDREVEVARLGPGDGFGEASLITGGPRGCGVSMITDGSLMRLPKSDFIDQIQGQLIRPLDVAEAKSRAADGAIWLDVRSESAFVSGHLADARNLPLESIRARASELSPEQEYLVYGEDKGDASIGTYLLRERGFDVYMVTVGAAALGSDEAVAPDPNAAPRMDADHSVPVASTGTAADEGEGEVLGPGQRIDQLEQLLSDTQSKFHKALHQRVAEIRHLKQLLEAAMAEKDGLAHRLRGAEAELEKLHDALKAARASSSKASSSVQAEERERLRQQITELKQELEEAQEVLQEASAEESARQWEKVRLQSRFDQVEQELAEQREVNRVLREENEETTRRLDALREEIARLETGMRQKVG